MIWQLVDSSGIGGIESHITNLTLALNAAGHPTKITLLKRHTTNPWFEQLNQKKLDWVCLADGFSNLRKTLKTERPALLHTHGYKAGILGRIAAKSLKIPVVSTFHAGERGKFPVSLYQTIDEWTSCLGARIAVNDIIAKQMPFKTQSIRNFILPFLPSPLAGEGDPKDRVRGIIKPISVGFVGRLSHEKAPDLFCKIAEQTNKSIPFHIFGDGIMRAVLEAKYSSRVTFHGVATNMESVWPKIGLLCMPSRAEGLPMAALEALNHGIPVLASKAGSFRSIITQNETGWVNSIDDLSSMVLAVENWAASSAQARIKLSQNCIIDVQKRFGANEPLAQILTIYEKERLNL